MKTSRISNNAAAARLLAATALAALGIASPALAQESAAQQEGEGQTIVVTGRSSQVELTQDYAGGLVARGSRAGLLGNLDMMESPFSSTAFTEKLMQDQQAESIGDVLKNEPGVQVTRGFGNFQQVYRVRGFPTFSDEMMYNGVYGILPRQFVAPEMLERVEIFRGANSFLNGAAPGGSGVGGSVNVVPKRAPRDGVTNATFGGGNKGNGYAAFDVGRRFGPGKHFGMRANAAIREGETAIEDQERSMHVFSLGFDYRGSQLRFTADAGYQEQFIDRPQPSVTPSGAAPRPPKASSNFGQPWTFSNEKQLFGAVRGEFDITKGVTIWAAAGGRKGKENNVLANPTSNPLGATSAFRFDNARKDSIISADAGIRFEFETGPLKHRVIASGSIFHSEFKNAFDFYFTPTIGDLYDFVPAPETSGGFIFSGGDLDHPLKTEDAKTRSLAAADIIQAFDEKVTAILGVRYQKIDRASFDFNTGAETDRLKGHAYTPAFGLVVRPVKQVSIFGNYAESLVPGARAPLTTPGGGPVENAGEVFPPFRAKQKEVGVKVDLGRFGGTLSAFTVALPSASLDGNVFRVTGEERHRGLELNMFGEPVEGVRLLGGATYIDAEMTKNPNPAIQGMRPIGVPKWQTSLGAEWDIPGAKNLTIDGRMIHSSRQYIDALNVHTIPSYAVFDLGVRYKIDVREDQALILRARVENVANKNYWSAAGGFPGANYLVLGEPRTFFVSAAFEM